MKTSDIEYIAALVRLKDFLDGNHDNTHTVDAIHHVQNSIVDGTVPGFAVSFQKEGVVVRLFLAWRLNLRENIRQRSVEISVGGFSMPVGKAKALSALLAQAATFAEEIEKLIPEKLEF